MRTLHNNNRIYLLLVLLGLSMMFVSCDQSDELYFSSPSYQEQHPDTSLWDTLGNLSDTGINVVIEVDRGDGRWPTGVVQGQHAYVDVSIDAKGTLLAGLDLLVYYDAGALAFQTAQAGELFEACDWEYFSYRFGSPAESGLPSGVLRLVAIAETNNGAHHPVCYGLGYPAKFVELDFLVSNDRTYECAFLPIGFCWSDCDDNTFALYEDSSRNERYKGYSRQVWESDGRVYTPVQFEPVGFPSFEGAPDSCLVVVPEHPGRRSLNFFNGGVQVTCADYIDLAGDVNLNGEPCEIADAVLYTNYFIFGIDVFKVNVAVQIEASDVNTDGVGLTVPDLVYLIDIILGTAVPLDQVHREQSIFSSRGDTLWVEKEVGGLYVEVLGDVTPVLLADDMEIKYRFDGEVTRILVSSMVGDSASGDLLYVPGGWRHIEAATPEGGELLLVNDFGTIDLTASPNPFADSVVLSFDWPFAEDYLLRVYDITGRSAVAFAGRAFGIGQTLVWHAEDFRPGAYYARLYHNDQLVGSATLLKGE